MSAVIGVYNAEGSLKGELTYLLKKTLGRGHCSLCDLTHGWSPRMKRSWREACDQSPLEVNLLHLDELNEEQAQVVLLAPVFMAHLGDRWLLVMNAAEISAHAGDPEGLLSALRERLLERSV